VYTLPMYTCPRCTQTRYQTSAGLTGAGSQRVRCGGCGTRSTAQPTPRGDDPAVRTQALTLYVEGMNVRRIARQFDLHHHTVITWVNAAADRLPHVPPQPKQVDTMELDALDTVVGSKNHAPTSYPPWIARCRASCGGRSWPCATAVRFTRWWLVRRTPTPPTAMGFSAIKR